MKEEDQGTLVVDPEYKVQFASGIACDLELQQALIRQFRMRHRGGLPSLISLNDIDRPLIVMISETPDAIACFVQRAEQGDPLREFIRTVPFATDILRHFIVNPYEAITVVDEKGIIRYISPIHEKFFNIQHGSAIGVPVNEIIENTRLDVVLKTGRAEIGQTQEMQGTTRVVSRTPIHDIHGKVVGAIGQVMFKSPDALSAMSAEIGRLRQEVSFYKREFNAAQLQTRGLSSIIGNSDAILKLKEQILKVASLDVPVLLQGESGVGKDLVAHCSPYAESPLTCPSGRNQRSSIACELGRKRTIWLRKRRLHGR